MGSLGKTLENLTNVAIFIVCLLIFSLFLFHKWDSHAASSNISETHFVGKVITLFPVINGPAILKLLCSRFGKSATVVKPACPSINDLAVLNAKASYVSICSPSCLTAGPREMGRRLSLRYRVDGPSEKICGSYFHRI